MLQIGIYSIGADAARRIRTRLEEIDHGAKQQLGCLQCLEEHRLDARYHGNGIYKLCKVRCGQSAGGLYIPYNHMRELRGGN